MVASWICLRKWKHCKALINLIKMSDSSIMSIREMIDVSFGSPDANKVNFKLIQTVLLILARQLRILERQVCINIDPGVAGSGSSMNIREVKLQTRVSRKKRKVSDTSVGKRHRSKSQRPETKDNNINKPTTEKSSGSKSTTDKTSDSKSTTGKTSASKSTAEKSSSSKSTTDKTGETKSSTDKTSESKSTTNKTSGSKSTTDKSTDKSTADKISSSNKIGTIERIPGVTPSSEDKTKDFDKYIEELEQQRETELRVIRQRSDSRDVAEKTPSAMASLEAMEYVQYEKLLVVERRPSEGLLKPNKSGRLSIVTQEQFDELAKEVKQLEAQFNITGSADFPENMELMKELRSGASLTDAMAALQLSARVEAAEKTIKQMTELITDLAIEKGIDVTLLKEPFASSRTKLIFKAEKAGQSSRKRKEQEDLDNEMDDYYDEQPMHEGENLPEMQNETAEVAKPVFVTPSQALPTLKEDWINIKELDTTMQEIYDNIVKNVTNIINKVSSNADVALKMSTKLENQLTRALDLEDRMDDLVVVVSQYTDKINELDTGLSSQMTNYQELLTQMQHDLELGLESMAEALANVSGDPIAVAELNMNFTNLQLDIDATHNKQKELEENQNLISTDLQALLRQIELLKEEKSDREEVTDALRDKAGIDALNGLVTLQQSNAVRGDLEKRIGSAYDKFNSQEIIWQKAIDELHRELDEKADVIQVVSLREDINNHLENLRSKLQAIKEIVGEPRAAAVSKKLFRDADCLSCSLPAHMDITEPDVVPPLPAYKSYLNNNDKNKKPKEDGDYGVCYSGKPITHPIDTRAQFCRRYCGGSYTARANKPLTGVVVRPAITNTTDEDGHITEEIKGKHIPCIPCNPPRLAHVSAVTEVALSLPKFSMDSLPADFSHVAISLVKNDRLNDIDVILKTPPMTLEE